MGTFRPGSNKAGLPPDDFALPRPPRKAVNGDVAMHPLECARMALDAADRLRDDPLADSCRLIAQDAVTDWLRDQMGWTEWE